MRPPWLCGLSALFVTAALAAPALSDSRVWDAGGTGSDWFTPENWDPNGVPDPADELSVPGGMPTTVKDVSTSDGGRIVLNGGSVTAGLRNVYAGNTGEGLVEVLGGALLTGAEGSIGGQADGNGVVRVDGNAPGGVNSRWQNTGRIYVGKVGTGRLDITRGGDVTCSEGSVGWDPGSVGTAVIDGDGSTWQATTNVVVGDWGTGTMLVRNGAEVSNAHGYIGSGATGIAPERGDGSVTVQGEESAWQNSGTLSVGYRGTGVMTICGGGWVLNRDDAYVGEKPDANGSVTVEGAGVVAPSTWESRGMVYLGYDGVASLRVLSGGQALAASARLAEKKDSRADVRVEGAGSTWTNSGVLYVGKQGEASLTVRDGAGVSNGTCWIAADSTATGTVLVEGTGSTWGGTSPLYVGRGGTGSLTVRDAGLVVNGTAYVGYYLNSNGTAAVEGANSTWTSIGDLYVAYSGPGRLTVAGTAVIAGQTGYVGYNSSAVGTVTIDGNGSTWENHRDLSVGYKGTGMLAVSGGAVVRDIVGNVAHEPLSKGTVSVDGNGSTWENRGDLYVGRRGDGTLTVTGGGCVTTSLCHVGDRGDGNGTVTVNGSDPAGTPSTLSSSGALYVSWLGDGLLSVSGGGLVSSDFTEVGAHAGADGRVVVEGSAPGGAPATLHQNSYLYVGTEGDGSLAVRGGGVAESSLGVLGFDSGSDGNAVVSGAGSRWENAGALTVGREGTGRLEVRDGGGVSSSAGYVASFALSQGAVAVEGARSRWTVTDELSVGDRSRGTLAVSGGGRVSCSAGYIAPEADANGQVTVSGDGSSWAVAGPLYVAGGEHGRGGTGELNVDGGTVTVCQTLKVWQDGTVNLAAGLLYANVVELDDDATFGFTGGRLTVSTFHGDLLNAGGEVSTGHSCGVMVIDGNYVQAPAGSLAIEPGATLDAGILPPYGHLHVEGDANLDGTLSLAVLGDVAYGQTFEILSAGAIEGTFDAVLGAAVDANTSLAVVYGADAVTLVAAVPGDADLDGQVTGEDLLALEAGSDLADPTWVDGDFDQDGDVDHADYLTWKHYAGPGGGSIPEPASLLFLIAAAPFFPLRRRPRKAR